MKYSCQVSVSSFDFERFEKVDRKIKESFQRDSKNLLKVNGPLPLKRKEKLFTVNRSPHGNKKARDQFFLMQYKRLWLLQGQGIKASLFSSKILSVFRELSALEGISFSWTFSLKKLLEKKS